MDLELSGQTALVTGASRGIGYAIAQGLVREGCHLQLASRTAADLESARGRLLQESKVSIDTHALDLGRSENVERLAAACADVDILINNAGAIPAGGLLDVNEARWREAWELKVFGFINLSRAVYARMRERRRGVIINVIGVSGERMRGNFIAGSVVRTEAQVSRRATLLPVSNAITTSGGQGGGGSDNLFQGDLRILDTDYNRIFGIPQGFEGILTLRGGEIRGFTDGNFVLNQSRLFTQRGGDITLWSSNGDLNAGQGSRNASSFPPIVLRFSPDGTAEVDSAGSVSGAGIGAFRPSLDVLPSSVRLIAPVGTVDAGDAGVRASGDIFVAAARVANADNFAAGGSISGVPSLAGPAAPAVPSSAAAAVAANALRANKATGGNANQGSRIFVDVLGHFSGSGTTCEEGQHPDIDGQCVPD